MTALTPKNLSSTVSDNQIISVDQISNETNYPFSLNIGREFPITITRSIGLELLNALYFNPKNEIRLENGLYLNWYPLKIAFDAVSKVEEYNPSSLFF